MKGMVFTEFLEMVETAYGMPMVDKIMDEANLPSGGAYTAIGTYDHQEMVVLVGNLSQVTGVPVPNLLKLYGRHLFGRFVASYPRFFHGVTDCLTFLERIDGHIHQEVLKLYPDAELPHFSHSRLSPDELELVYTSKRSLGDFAQGLIEGCADHFKEKISIESFQLPCKDGSSIRFFLKKDRDGSHA